MSHVPEHDLDPEEVEQEEDAFDSSSQGSSTQTSTITWINWFASLPGHDYYCEVHEDFIDDDFNLTGLQSMVPFWKEALDMVLDVEPDEDFSKIPDVSIVENSAELLYGLVHQRFILTKAGLSLMAEKYDMGHFGTCPRVFCQGTHVLPCGRADLPGVDTVKLACPNCGDIYTPPSSKYIGLDGAFFGTTFAPLFFQTYPELLSMPFCPPSASHGGASGSMTPGVDSRASPAPSAASHPDGPGALTPASGSGSGAGAGAGAGALATPIGGETLTNPNPHGGQRIAEGRVYVPRIYGFKVSERARSGPRMRWLRERPAAWDELDQVVLSGGGGGGGSGGASGSGGAGPGQGQGQGGRGLYTPPRGQGSGSGSGSAQGHGQQGQGQGQGREGRTWTMGGAGEGRLFDDDDDDDDGRGAGAGAGAGPGQGQGQAVGPQYGKGRAGPSGGAL